MEIYYAACSDMPLMISRLIMGRKTCKPDGVCFYPNALAKQSRQGSQIANFFFPSFLRTLRYVL